MNKNINFTESFETELVNAGFIPHYWDSGEILYYKKSVYVIGELNEFFNFEYPCWVEIQINSEDPGYSVEGTFSKCNDIYALIEIAKIQ